MSTRRKPAHFAPHEAIVKVSLAALDPDRAQFAVDLIADIAGEPTEVWEVAR